MTFLSLFISPILLLLFLVYLKNRFNTSNFYNFSKAVILSFIAVILLILSDYFFEWKWHNNIRNIKRMVTYVFFGIAFSSEFAKFLVLRYGFVKKGIIKNALNGAVYGIIIGLAFNTLSNILFYSGLIGTDRIHFPNLLLWSYPFASIILGIILGFFVGQGETRKNAFIDSMVGLFLATFFHAALYFCFVTSDIRLFLVTGLGFLIIGTGLLIRAINLKD